MGANISNLTTGCFKATSEQNEVQPNIVEPNKVLLHHGNFLSQNWEITSRVSTMADGRHLVKIFAAMMINGRDTIHIYEIFCLKMLERPSRIVLDLNDRRDFSITVYVGETIRHSTTWDPTEYMVQDNGIFTSLVKKTSDGITVRTSQIDDKDADTVESSSASASRAPEVVPTNESAQGGSGSGLDTLSAQRFCSDKEQEETINFFDRKFSVSTNADGHKVLAIKEENISWRSTDFGFGDNIADIRIIALSETELLFVITQKSGHSCAFGFTKDRESFVNPSMMYLTTETIGGKLFKDIRVKGIESSKTGFDRDGQYIREIHVSYTDDTTRVFHYRRDGNIQIPKK